jgi:hypothetical protein
MLHHTTSSATGVACMTELGSKCLLLLTLHAPLAAHRNQTGTKLETSFLLATICILRKYGGCQGELSPMVLPGYGPHVLHYQHALQDVPTDAIVAQQYWCNQSHSSWILDLLHGRGLMCGSVSQDRNL